MDSSQLPANSCAAWEKDYCRRGRLWGGGVRGLPALPEGSTVLELGCGDGKTLAGMSDRGWRAVALDFSPQAVRQSRHSVSLPPDAHLLLADACRLPFRGESFDAIFAFHVTGHQRLAGRKLMAAEAARVLRIGGSLFFREFGSDDMRAEEGEKVEPCTYLRGEGITTHYFTEREAADLFCLLTPVEVQTHRWTMRVKGKDLVRSEIEAVFQKIKR